MGKLRSLLVGLLMGAGGMYVGLQYHLLQADEGYLIVPRTPQQRLQDTYTDVRDWDAGAWTARPQLALAVTQHGRGDLISEGVKTNLLDSLRESLSPVQQELNKSSRGWEPTTTTRAPVGEESRPSQAAAPHEESPPRRGFLPLAELFGINEQTLSEIRNTPILPNDSANTQVLPAGSTRPKPVEILPSPGEFEFLRGPQDFYGAPSAPVPGSKHSMDRRRSDAGSGWEPLSVKPF